MIASLPMYERDELAAAHRRYWALIREQLMQQGFDVAASLVSDGVGDEFWMAGELILSQTCGYPYRSRLHGKVQLVGTPDWGLADCAAGYYYSVVVIQASDNRNSLAEFNEATFALNSLDSQSGYIAMRSHLANQGGWFGQELISGSHEESARLVAAGDAEIAALDIISWRHMRRYDQFTDQLRVLLTTEPTPALPYITAKGIDRTIVFHALKVAVSRLNKEDRELLGIYGIVHIPAPSYLGVATPN